MEEKNRLNMVRVEFHEGKLRQGWGFGVFSEGSVTICRGKCLYKTRELLDW